MKVKIVKPSENHVRLRDAILAAMRKEGADMPAEELLAIMAHTVGQLIAMQDQRTMTVERALAIVSANMEAGNAQFVEKVLSAGGTPS